MTTKKKPTTLYRLKLETLDGETVAVTIIQVTEKRKLLWLPSGPWYKDAIKRFLERKKDGEPSYRAEMPKV